MFSLTLGCRQAKPMLKRIDLNLSKYALRLTRRDIRILLGLLTNMQMSAQRAAIKCSIAGA